MIDADSEITMLLAKNISSSESSLLETVRSSKELSVLREVVANIGPGVSSQVLVSVAKREICDQELLSSIIEKQFSFEIMLAICKNANANTETLKHIMGLSALDTEQEQSSGADAGSSENPQPKEHSLDIENTGRSYLRILPVSLQQRSSYVRQNQQKPVPPEQTDQKDTFLQIFLALAEHPNSNRDVLYKVWEILLRSFLNNFRAESGTSFSFPINSDITKTICAIIVHKHTDINLLNEVINSLLPSPNISEEILKLLVENVFEKTKSIENIDYPELLAKVIDKTTSSELLTAINKECKGPQIDLMLVKNEHITIADLKIILERINSALASEQNPEKSEATIAFWEAILHLTFAKNSGESIDFLLAQNPKISEEDLGKIAERSVKDETFAAIVANKISSSKIHKTISKKSNTSGMTLKLIFDRGANDPSILLDLVKHPNASEELLFLIAESENSDRADILEALVTHDNCFAKSALLAIAKKTALTRVIEKTLKNKVSFDWWLWQYSKGLHKQVLTIITESTPAEISILLDKVVQFYSSNQVVYDEGISSAIVKNPSTPSEYLKYVADNTKDEIILAEIIKHANIDNNVVATVAQKTTSIDVLQMAIDYNSKPKVAADLGVELAIISNPNVSIEYLQKISNSSTNDDVLSKIVQHASVTSEIVLVIAKKTASIDVLEAVLAYNHKLEDIDLAIISNPHVAVRNLLSIANNSINQSVLEKISEHDKVDLQIAQGLIENSNSSAQVLATIAKKIITEKIVDAYDLYPSLIQRLIVVQDTQNLIDLLRGYEVAKQDILEELARYETDSKDLLLLIADHANSSEAVFSQLSIKPFNCAELVEKIVERTALIGPAAISKLIKRDDVNLEILSIMAPKISDPDLLLDIYNRVNVDDTPPSSSLDAIYLCVLEHCSLDEEQLKSIIVKTSDANVLAKAASKKLSDNHCKLSCYELIVANNNSDHRALEIIARDQVFAQHLSKLLRHPNANEELFKIIAAMENVDPKILGVIIKKDISTDLSLEIAKNKNTRKDDLVRLAKKSSDLATIEYISEHDNADENVFQVIVKKSTVSEKALQRIVELAKLNQTIVSVIENPNATSDIVDYILENKISTSKMLKAMAARENIRHEIKSKAEWILKTKEDNADKYNALIKEYQDKKFLKLRKAFPSALDIFFSSVEDGKRYVDEFCLEDYRGCFLELLLLENGEEVDEVISNLFISERSFKKISLHSNYILYMAITEQSSERSELLAKGLFAAKLGTSCLTIKISAYSQNNFDCQSEDLVELSIKKNHKVFIAMLRKFKSADILRNRHVKVSVEENLGRGHLEKMFSACSAKTLCDFVNDLELDKEGMLAYLKQDLTGEYREYHELLCENFMQKISSIKAEDLNEQHKEAAIKVLKHTDNETHWEAIGNNLLPLLNERQLLKIVFSSSSTTLVEDLPSDHRVNLLNLVSFCKEQATITCIKPNILQHIWPQLLSKIKNNQGEKDSSFYQELLSLVSDNEKIKLWSLFYTMPNTLMLQEIVRKFFCSSVPKKYKILEQAFKDCISSEDLPNLARLFKAKPLHDQDELDVAINNFFEPLLIGDKEMMDVVTEEIGPASSASDVIPDRHSSGLIFSTTFNENKMKLKPRI